MDRRFPESGRLACQGPDASVYSRCLYVSNKSALFILSILSPPTHASCENTQTPFYFPAVPMEICTLKGCINADPLHHIGTSLPTMPSKSSAYIHFAFPIFQEKISFCQLIHL